MSDFRSLVLAVVSMLAAALLLAGSASAQSIEIVEESTGLHCPPVALIGTEVSGGCEGHAASNGEVDMEAFGALVSACNLELNAHMDEDGNGYVDEMAVDGPNCSTPPCVSGGQQVPWPITLGEPSPGMLEGEVIFCIESGTLGTIVCHVSSIGVTFTGHSKEEDWNQAPCESPWDFLHLTGSGSTETLDAEVIHR